MYVIWPFCSSSSNISGDVDGHSWSEFPLLNLGNIALIWVWPRFKKKSTTIFIPLHENTLPKSLPCLKQVFIFIFYLSFLLDNKLIFYSLATLLPSIIINFKLDEEYEFEFATLLKFNLLNKKIRTYFFKKFHHVRQPFSKKLANNVYYWFILLKSRIRYRVNKKETNRKKVHTQKL